MHQDGLDEGILDMFVIKEKPILLNHMTFKEKT